jgi:type I phosphodiesterase/nucleotide pyrophosphatase
MRTRRLFIFALMASMLMTVLSPPATSVPAAPSRVLIIVLDQMRPDYVERFDMANVRALLNGGVNFPRAVLGHMAAETVISHNVITSGLFPKHMGWTNEVYRDVGNVLGGGNNAYYVSSSWSCDQFGTLVNAKGYPKLEDYLGEGASDAKFVAIGQKTTASCGAGQPAVSGTDNDIIVRMGSSATLDCDQDGTPESWRGPSGVNVPAYIATTCGRFYVNTTPTYGTATTPPAWMYPLDGDRFAKGTDPAHLGGDVWTADTAIAVMENESDWKGMLVSFPSIDKMAHMWGTNDDGPSGVGEDTVAFAHLPEVARIADQQVGRLLDELQDQGLADDTLVVLTTDHAGQTARRFHGINQAGRSNFNWYYGAETGSLADEEYLEPSPAIRRFINALDGNVDFTYQDGHIAAWLHDRSIPAKRAAARALRELPSVIATYFRDGGRYQLEWSGGLASASERAWWRANAQRFINTMAAPNGPDAVALLRDQTSYGVKGDHGGHQRPIQRIPIAFSWPGLKGGATPGRQIRSVDILPTILGLMGIASDPAHPMDGRAVVLPLAP